MMNDYAADDDLSSTALAKRRKRDRVRMAEAELLAAKGEAPEPRDWDDGVSPDTINLGDPPQRHVRRKLAKRKGRKRS